VHDLVLVGNFGGFMLVRFNQSYTNEAIRMSLIIPARLAATCSNDRERAEWLGRLPDVVRELERRWSLTLGRPFDGEDVSCAWVAPVTAGNGTPAVLKIGMPHMEGESEIDGLRFWDGDPTVQLLDADDTLGAMLLERCEPGTALRTLPEPEQDVVIAQLLRRLWRPVMEPHGFRPLSFMLAAWSEETLSQADHWPDSGLVREGLRLFSELAANAPLEALLATDLHAGNVLRAKREPWLVIDPKPFVGDPAYDATQHLFNCETRLLVDPQGTIGRFADLLGVDRERVRLWMFARAAAEPRDDWRNAGRASLARALRPSESIRL
jgi:streptomycin 6-kinase